MLAVDRVIFTSNASREVFAHNALKVYPNSRDGFELTMLKYDVNLVVPKRKFWSIETRLYELLHLTRDLEIIVQNFVNKHSICNMTSMHIRKTDMEIELNVKQRRGAICQYINMSICQ